jgi:hypothetical protein
MLSMRMLTQLSFDVLVVDYSNDISSGLIRNHYLITRVILWFPSE